jgi:leader peptidase (prepilin peptidase)/N-methyltransferase
MQLLLIISVFIFGSIIGSFLNVVIYRYNSSASPLKGRSQCFSCGKTLTPLELVPIFSFLFSKGRCRGCGVRISWQYLIVELLIGAMFVAVFLLEKSLLESAFLIIIFSTLLVIAVYDMRHQIIPDGLAMLFALLALLRFLSEVGIAHAVYLPDAWTLIAGPMLFLPFWALWYASQGRWLGLGDGKLAFGMGWFLGVGQGATAVILAFWIGAAYALTLMAIQSIAIRARAYASQKSKAKKSTKFAYLYARSTLRTLDFMGSTGKRLSMQSAIPFGPLLILALFIVYFTQVNFFGPLGILYLPQ